VLGAVGAVVVAVHVLSEQRHLLVAAAAEVFKLAQDAIDRAAAFATAGIGNYAVGAEVVASAHYAYVSAHGLAGDACGHHVAISLGCAQLHVYCLAAFFGGGK